MDYEASMHDVLLERLLHDENAEPKELPLSLLRAITNNFADAQKIGEDRYCRVYKGVLRNGEVVAVKKMNPSPQSMEEIRFLNEFGCLMRIGAKQHKNIVRFLGYHTSDTQTQGKAYEPQMLLCFEYPSGGILDTSITDASSGLSWRKRYKIIKGICEGLCYLHQNLTLHLDLKAANIWLDEKKVPKIQDFGGSKRLNEKQSELVENHEYLSMANEPPEFLRNGVITMKTDIYSLGVVISEILTGKSGMTSEHYTLKNVKTVKIRDNTR